jgi:Family of unknown function (DUF6011)
MNATDNQIRELLALAWQRCGATAAELQDYAVRFQSMTYDQVDDLIDTWAELSITCHAPMPFAAPIAQTLPHPPTVVPVPPMTPVVARRMAAKYSSTCPACHKQILAGQEIFYIKGYKATHVACGVPTAVGGIAVQKTQGQAPAQPSAFQPPPVSRCTICNETFVSDAVRDHHVELVHTFTVKCHVCRQEFATAAVCDNHVRLMHFRIEQKDIPEPGYYSVTIPVPSENNEMLVRFYRVTKRRNSDYKTFSRMSSDRPIAIDPIEAKLAAAVINAAPQLAMSAYGKLIGHCGCCGRALTDEESRARGIGPECIKKYSNYI